MPRKIVSLRIDPADGPGGFRYALLMGKLKPVYLYRLRLLYAAPRYYAPQSINHYLEKRGLIRRTGRALPARRHEEYEITEAGRTAFDAALAAPE